MVYVRNSLRVPSSCVVQTPNELASAMVGALGVKTGEKWLEPCVGQGALLSAMSKMGIARNQIVGVDVNPRPELNDELAQVNRGVEFLGWAQTTELRFDKVVANPPYVALERLNSKIRSAASTVALFDEVKVHGNANAWYAFLCAAIGLLKPGGSLCFLLPAAWDFANYATPLRGAIARYFNSVEVYRTTMPIFRAVKVQDGSIVLVARGFNPSRRTQNEALTQRVVVDSIEELIASLRESCGKSAVDNALRSFPAPNVIISGNAQRLDSLMKVGLGVVTGDSDYFLLKESERLELGLPNCSTVPVLSRARHLVTGRMTLACWKRLKDWDERVWLFNPSSAALKYKSVQAYLRAGRNGACNRAGHKISLREVWYRANLPPQIDGFMSGMSMAMPWICFRDMPRLVATNTLYTVTFSCTVPSALKLAVGMSLLCSTVREQLALAARPYADGLLKHEPGDLSKLMVPALGSVVCTWKDYRRAIMALREGDEREVRRIADASLRRQN